MTVMNVWIPAPPLEVEWPLECQSVERFCNTNRGQSNPSWHVKWTQALEGSLGYRGGDWSNVA